MTAELTVVQLPEETTLNLGSVVQQVAAALDRASSEALSVRQLIDGYKHIPDTDFSRLRRVVDDLRTASDTEVLCWMARQAAARIAQEVPGSIEIADDRLRLRDGIGLADLRWHGRPIVAPNTSDPHRRLNDPFNKKRATGTPNANNAVFVDDIRSAAAIAKDDLTELRESMQTYGWFDDPIFEALQDEHGVVLVGHRRIRVAEELGIAPRIRTVTCGRGDVGDIKRLGYAVVSNIGRRDMSKGDRQNIVKVLAGPDHDWTQMSIAKALGVSQGQIAKDIAALKEAGELFHRNNSQSLTDLPSDPRSKTSKRGRPPKVKTGKKDNPKLHDAIDEMWDRAGEPPTSPEIIETASNLGIDIAKDTALKARDIVEARRDAVQDCQCGGTCPCHNT